jgi:hypothetical protein
MKACFCCNRILPLEAFHKHSGMKDGHLNKCAECVRAYVKSWREDNLGYVQAYDRERSRIRTEKGLTAEVARRFRETHSDYAERQKEWQSRNPQKRAAQISVGNAIRDGQLLQQPCERCGNTDVHGHHEDYSRPLDVMWLCSKHHGERHRELNAMKRKDDIMPERDSAGAISAECQKQETQPMAYAPEGSSY